MSSIGIIGAGHMGETLARRLGPLGHQVKIANTRSPSTLHRLARVDGVQPVWAMEVFADTDVAILAISQGKTVVLPSPVKDQLSAVPVVIDIANDGPDQVAELPAGKPITEWLSEQLGKPLYKVFNNIEPHWLGFGARGKGDPDRFGLPISGPQGTSLAEVETLIDQLGFDPVYNGDLDQSWRQQPGTKSFCANLPASELRAALAEATPEQSRLSANSVMYFVDDSGNTDGVTFSDYELSAHRTHQQRRVRDYFGEVFGDF